MTTYPTSMKKNHSQWVVALNWQHASILIRNTRYKKMAIALANAVAASYNCFDRQRCTMCSKVKSCQRVGNGVLSAISPGIAAVMQRELTSKSSMRKRRVLQKCRALKPNMRTKNEEQGRPLVVEKAAYNVCNATKWGSEKQTWGHWKETSKQANSLRTENYLRCPR